MKKELPIMELLPTGKKDKYGSDLFHLYVNGKTDKSNYEQDAEAYLGGHELKFGKLLMSIPTRCFPDNVYIGFEFGSLIIKGLINSVDYFNIVKAYNKFTIYIAFEKEVSGNSDLITINYLKIAELLNKELKKDKKIKLIFKTEADNQISIEVKPDETLLQVVNKLTLHLNKAMNNVNIHLLDEVKKLEKSIHTAAKIGFTH